MHVHAGMQCIAQGPAAVAAVADMSEFTWSRISWQAVQTAFQPPVVIKRVEDPRLARLATWTAESVGAALHESAGALGIGMGKIAQPLRVAMTGTQVSPDISHTVYLAGQGEALKRIDAALARIPV